MTRKTKPTEDGEVVKRLFTPEKAATVRKPLHEYGWYWGSKGKHNFGIGVCGALLFLVFCVSFVLITVKLNTTWTDVTMEVFLALVLISDIHKFFSNELLRPQSPDVGILTVYTSYFYFNGQPLFGFLGALPLAALLGITCGAFTCLFMFYDSDEPGNFPPTPVSPRLRRTGRRALSTEWHLGYLFVPVNILVSFSLALFYFRWNMGLPMV